MTKQEYISERLEGDFIRYVLLQEPRFSDAEVSEKLVQSLKGIGLYEKMKGAIAAVVERHLSAERLRDDKGAYVTVLPQWLNLGLLNEVVADFRTVVEGIIGGHDYMSALLSQIERLTWVQGVDDMAQNLRSFCGKMAKNACMYGGMPHVDLSGFELEAKEEAARRITVKERLTNSNDGDILDFCRALAGAAHELCEAEIYEQLSKLYRSVAEAAELARIINAFDTAHSLAKSKQSELANLGSEAGWSEEYERLVPVSFFERNIESVSGAMAFHSILFMTFARHEDVLVGEGYLSPDGDLRVFTSPRFDGRNWTDIDFGKLL